MFNFVWPWVFLTLPLPWLFYRGLKPAMPQQNALKTPFFAELNQLAALPGHPSYLKLFRLFCLICIWILVVSAAARPQQVSVQPDFSIDGRAMFLAIDLSNSMLIQDIATSKKAITRMDLVKRMTSAFIQQRAGERIGLILFASRPYIQSPLTYDHQTLLHWINDAQPGLAGDKTAIGDAIGLAIKHLQHQPTENKVLVLITDGANNSGVMPPMTAAQLAAQQKLKIYTLGVGSVSDNQGEDALHNLDEPLLQAIAQETGTQYTRLQRLGQIPELINQLQQLESIKQPSVTHYAHELFYWPLLGALILSSMLALTSLVRNLRHPQQEVA